MGNHHDYEAFLEFYVEEINKILEKIENGKITRPEYANLKIRALEAKMAGLKALNEKVALNTILYTESKQRKERKLDA